ncbi:matrixin family metalloprotease (plasmid) [Streptomyces sp. NBC_00435]|uniref:matrixin family metalloprotease n=1 Tax=Streptomyces sp. NBC_00435 TaxID=2903649 RepID=UPI002E2378EF
MRTSRLLVGAASAAVVLTLTVLLAPDASAGPGPAVPVRPANPAPEAGLGVTAGGGHPVEVEARYATADGVTHVTTYLAAPGVSARQLAGRLSYDSVRYFIDGTVSIKYNNSYPSNHRAVVCHESGHAFGLGHNTSTNSCLYASNPQANLPNADDCAEIVNQLYPR